MLSIVFSSPASGLSRTMGPRSSFDPSTASPRRPVGALAIATAVERFTAGAGRRLAVLEGLAAGGAGLGEGHREVGEVTQGQIRGFERSFEAESEARDAGESRECFYHRAPSV